MHVTTPLLLTVIAASLVVLWMEYRKRSDGQTLHFENFYCELQTLNEHLERLLVGVDETRLRNLEDAIERLPRKWEDIKREAQAADARARHHARRVRQELEDRGLTDEGVEALAEQFQLVNDDGSTRGGVQPMRENMASVPEGAEPESGDLMAEIHRKKWGVPS